MKKFSLIIKIILVVLLATTLFLAFKYREVLARGYAVAKNFAKPNADLVDFENGRLNILVLGRGSIDHEGSDLTDTMMVVSLPKDISTIYTLTVPRDIWITPLKTKINSTYHYGGKDLAQKTMEDVLGIKIPYVIIVDFSGFEKIIDSVGGVDVYVETAFIDDQYPIAGKENDECGGDKTYACRYETIKFDSGLNHMDGATALKFVRSRHSQDDQGTDIARGIRQQLVVKALLDKVSDPSFFVRLKNISKLSTAVLSSLEYDLTDPQVAVLVRKFFDSRHLIHDLEFPENLIYYPGVLRLYDNQYVFIPKGGNWDELHKWVESSIK